MTCIHSPLSQEQKEELAVLKEQFSALALKLPEDEFPIDLVAIYPETSQLRELYEQLTDLKKCLDSFRPFNPAQMQNLE